MTKSVFTKKHDLLRQMLVQARSELGLTQVQLAGRLSRPQSFVSKVERGERRLDLIEFLEVAQALDIDPFAFLKALHDPDGTQGRSTRREDRAGGKTSKLR